MAHFNLGTAFAAQEQFADAAREFHDALRIQPDYVNARFNLASALANLGRFDEAIRQFQEVVRAQPDFPGARQAIEECARMRSGTTRR
jgi:tetratricopeptide (TPR) repeat protein